MPIQYLLPCPDCEHTLSLTTSQAGQPLQCPHCDSSVDAPKLGTLKQLPVQEDTATTQSASNDGSTGWKRHVFAFGLITAVVAGIAGIALFFYAQSLFTPTDVEGHITMMDNELDQLTPVQLWDLWHQQEYDDGLGEWTELKYVGYNKQSEYLRYIAYGLLGIAGLGVVTLLSSFAMKR
jgi:hypothetical protein